MDLFLSRIHFPVTALGPGRRLGIWFQGCSIRCAGCISVDTWAPGKGRTTLSITLDEMSAWLAIADGVTISGGEPFDQPDALHELLRVLRTQSRADILVFTGYPWETLPEFAKSEALIDALITDPYRADLPQRLALRGSDNQRLHLLTQLGRQRFEPYARERDASDDRLDVGFDDDGTAWMAGIPKAGDLPKLITLLQAQGHEAHGAFDHRTISAPTDTQLATETEN